MVSFEREADRKILLQTYDDDRYPARFQKDRQTASPAGRLLQLQHAYRMGNINPEHPLFYALGCNKANRLRLSGHRLA